jgi:hypothetical protein
MPPTTHTTIATLIPTFDNRSRTAIQPIAYLSLAGADRECLALTIRIRRFMFHRMVSVVRPLLVTVLCTGLGLGVAARDAPTQDRATLTCCHGGVDVFAFDWTIDAPDFIAPDVIVAPARPIVAAPTIGWTAPHAAPIPADVLDAAPKTSPPA